MALLRAVVAFVLTAALVVGVPAMLVVIVGNPFPSSIPSVDEVRILLTQNGEGFTNFIIGVLAILIWFIWAQLIVALIVEVVATIGHRETRRLPTAPGIQVLAARLIAAMTLATTLATAPILAPAVGALTFDDIAPTSAAAALVVDVGQLNADGFVDAGASAGSFGGAAAAAHWYAAQPAPQIAQGETTTSVVLDDHTELWDLADAAYGDGVSWKLIAQANAGFVDASGAMITNETESIAAGTELVLPTGADLSAVSAFGSTSVANDAVTGDAEDRAASSVLDLTDPSNEPSDAIRVVEQGDSMWSLAESEVERRLDRDASTAEVADYWVNVVDANQDVASGHVDLIYPGEELVLPGAGDARFADELLAETVLSENFTLAVPDAVGAVDGPADNRNSFTPSTTEAAPESEAEAQQAPESVSQPAPDAETANGAEQRDQTLEDGIGVVRAAGLAAFGAAVMSAGIVGALQRRRDLQRRTRPQGAMARQPSTEAEAFEAALAHASSELRESTQGSGWQMLPVEAVAAARSTGPLQIHAEESGRLHAVAVHAQPTPHADLALAWEPRRFDLEPEMGVEAVERALQVTIDETDVHATEPGIAAAPTALVAGTDPMTGQAVLIDLASSGTIGIQGDDRAVRRFARSAVLDLAVSDRADDLCVIAIRIGRELGDLERVRNVDTFADALAQAVRCGHAAPDSTTPVVVVSSVAPHEADQNLAALNDLGAVVLAPGLATPSQVVVDGELAKILPAGTTVVLSALDDDDYRSVAELVDVTSAAAVEMVHESRTVEDILDITTSAVCPVEAGPIEVKVLGPVKVAGAESFSSLKAVDVVTYLAFHRQGVDADQIKSWVWPTFDPPTDKAFANVMSRARTGLGSSEDGDPYLSRAGADKTYSLAQAVTTDFERFRAIVELANAAADRVATLGLLKQALELIRGVPFTGGSASSFAWADNHVRAHVEYTIDETVHRCADLALELDDLETARWAALKGLELVPGCEQCFRRRFLVAGAGNNRSELRRAMADLERSAAAELGEPEAVDTISGDLLDLYHQLDQALVAGPA